MSNSDASAVSPSLKSDIAPILDSHGGAGGLVGDKINDISLDLPSDPSGSNITAQALRNLSVENAMKAASDFKESSDTGQPDGDQKKMADKMAGAFDRMQPQQQPSNEADAMFLAMKKIVDAILKILKNLFGKGNDKDGEPTPGASGYGPEYDEIIAKMEKSMGGFEDHAKDMKKEQDLSVDEESGPSGPGGAGGPSAGKA